jgi:hypothetical protein
MKDVATDFLYWNPHGKRDMPHENTYIGVQFEVGGAHEDWGFVVVEFNYDKEIDAYHRKVVGSGRGIIKAVDSAKEHYSKAQ